MLTMHQRDRHHANEWRDTVSLQVIREEAERLRASRTPSPETWAKTFPSCSGPCEQGRKLCPAPTACRIADNDDLDPARGILVALGIVASIVAAVGLLHWWLA
jgi:hypothetical protein